MTAPIAVRKFCLRHKKPQPEPCAVCALKNAPKSVQSPVAVIDQPTALSDASTSVETAQATVDRLMETVDAAKTNEQVKQALHILSSPKSASAIRGKRWREEQKQKNPQFAQQEAERKTSERGEVKRVQEIEETLRSNPTPPLVLKDAPEGKGILLTGGYDTKKIDIVVTEHDRAKGGKSVLRAPARATAPDGYGGSKIEKTAANKLPEEFEDSFAPKFKNPKEVRLLHQFVYENTKKSSMKNPMRVCVLCNEQIGTGMDPGDSIAAGYHHLQKQHPEQFQNFLARLKNRGCTEDHEGMVRRHGGGALKVQCKRCRKILYKPPKKVPEQRSDKTVETAA